MIKQFHSYVYMQKNLKRTKNRCLYTNIPSSIIHSSLNVETTQMSMNRGVDKQSEVSTYSGVSFSLRKKF